MSSGAVYDWDLKEHGKPVSVAVPGPVRVTDSLYAKELALLGEGIAYLFEPLVHDELRDGTRIFPSSFNSRTIFSCSAGSEKFSKVVASPP